MKGAIRFRSCLGCGRPFEGYGDPIPVGAYVSCVHCAHLYVATADGVERVWLGLAPAELRRVHEEVLEAFWRAFIDDVCRQPTNERRAA